MEKKHNKVSKIEQTDHIWQVANYISQGHTKQQTLDWIVEELGISRRICSSYYHNALKQVIMDDDLLGDYKKTIQQQNYDRLEKIIDSTINGNAADKKVAIDAIKELNRMTDPGNGNSVTIGKNQGGEEVIQITFN